MPRRKPIQVTIETIVANAGTLDKFHKDVNGDEHFYLKVENDPYLPLVIEAWGGCVSVAHYYEQNGDLMRDPEIVFRGS